MPPADRNVVMQCAKCPLVINSAVGQFVICGGPCEKIFHVTCAGLQLDQIQHLSRNIVWLCERCLPTFHDWKRRLETDRSESSSVARDIAVIKNQIADIIDTVGSVSPMTSTSASSPALRHSTPVSASRTMDGTNVNFKLNRSDVNVVDDSGLQSTQTTQTDDGTSVIDTNSDESCLVFLTNIDSEVTEKDIQLMVCQCLDAPVKDCISVKKLVPKWFQSRSFHYVSFRVELNVKLKHKAMQASTWPSGIKYREFVCRPSIPWKPVTLC